MTETTQPIEMTEEARLKAQKRRNVWLAWSLVAFVVIVGLTTAIRIQETDFSGGDRLYFSGYLDEAAKEKSDREAEARYEASQAVESEQAAESAGDSDE